MRILITGGSGFLAKELKKYWAASANEVVLASRTELNLVDREKVKAYFKNNYFNVVIHTAIRGGKRDHKENIQDFYDNLEMFNNLLLSKKHFEFMFNFGSGAEFDRRRNIENLSEEEIVTLWPADYYGLCKNLITRKITEIDDKIFNLRLYGCFGESEEPQRLFRNSFSLIEQEKDITIFQDKYMDYFYAQDIGVVIDSILSDPSKQINKDINLCYDKKYLLSELVRVIIEVGGKGSFFTENAARGFSYTGSSEKLSSYNLKLTGLLKGIEICLKKWNKS